MLRNRILAGVGALAVLAWFAAARPHAQTVDQRVFFTFSGPVELPGVGLAPGRYLFHLPEPTNARDVVQVLSADGKKAYGMFFTKAIDRFEPAAKPEVRFMEAAAGAPAPIRTYWMPGERTGREFVYPKEQALRLAKTASEPVLTTQAHTTTTDETNTSALSRVSSGGSETQIAANAQPTSSTPVGASQTGQAATASVAIAPAKVTAQNAPQSARASLPQTGSEMPLVGVLGLCFLTLALALRFGRIDHA